MREEGGAGAEWRGREWSSPGQLTAAARVRLEIRATRKLKRPDGGAGTAARFSLCGDCPRVVRFRLLPGYDAAMPGPRLVTADCLRFRHQGGENISTPAAELHDGAAPFC